MDKSPQAVSGLLSYSTLFYSMLDHSSVSVSRLVSPLALTRAGGIRHLLPRPPISFSSVAACVRELHVEREVLFGSPPLHIANTLSNGLQGNSFLWLGTLPTSWHLCHGFRLPSP